jgi:hypothetical protein
MGWTLDDVWALPMHYYDFLVEELNTAAERRLKA